MKQQLPSSIPIHVHHINQIQLRRNIQMKPVRNARIEFSQIAVNIGARHQCDAIALARGGRSGRGRKVPFRS